MRIVIGAVALAALLGAAMIWVSKIGGAWTSTIVFIGIGLGLMVVAGAVGALVRKQKRRRTTDLRDSALW